MGEGAMRLLTRQILADGAADRWENEYGTGFPEGKVDILSQLRSLGRNPSPDSVDMVIDSKAWTEIECHECGGENVEVIELGQEPDYESSTAWICKHCLKKALAI